MDSLVATALRSLRLSGRSSMRPLLAISKKSNESCGYSLESATPRGSARFSINCGNTKANGCGRRLLLLTARACGEITRHIICSAPSWR